MTRVALLAALAACAHRPPGPDPATACIAGKAPPGLQVEIRPIDVAPPMIVGETGTFEICDLRAGLYQLAFSRGTSELLVDVPVAPGQRLVVDVCERPLAVSRWPLEDDPQLQPPTQIERCP